MALVYIPKGLEPEKGKTTFVLTSLARPFFTIPKMSVAPDGDQILNPYQPRAIGKGKDREVVAAPYTWPKGTLFIRLDNQKEKDMIRFLKHSPMCFPEDRPFSDLDPSIHWFRVYDPEKEAQSTVSAASLAFTAYSLIREHLGEISPDAESVSVKDKAALAAVYALLTGSTREVSPLVAMAEVLERAQSKPKEVISAINKSIGGDADAEIRFNELKEAGKLRQAGAYVMLIREGEKDVSIGSKKDVLRILGGTVNSEEDQRIKAILS